MSEKTERIISYGMLVLLILSLIPMMYLGRFNHPTGDDYYYGAVTNNVLQETGSVLHTLAEATKGVAVQYQRWQGTYSAMFLMHLPPQLWGDWAYRLFPTVLLLTLIGGIFYLGKPLLRTAMQGSKWFWVTVSAGVSLLAIQTVPTWGETFYWYNGAMYYTGFFALGLYLLGLFARWLYHGGKGKVVAMMVLGLFFAGGNYVSFLPVMLIVAAVLVYLICRKDKRWGGTALVLIFLVVGLLISAMAPGNQLRQDGMWQIPAWKAVAKSLVQGIRYVDAWTTIWWWLMAVVLTPFLWKYAPKVKSNLLWLAVFGYGYGVFCSMSCPTFYTMNSTGPARAVAIVYYGYVLTSICGYAWVLAWVKNQWMVLGERRGEKQQDVFAKFSDRKLINKGNYVWISLMIVLLVVQLAQGAFADLSVTVATRSLAGGEAAGYEAEYQERIEVWEDKKIQEVILQPYTNRPVMLYVGDFSGDPEEPTNRKVAEYYHKKSVYVEY